MNIIWNGFVERVEIAMMFKTSLSNQYSGLAAGLQIEYIPIFMLTEKQFVYIIIMWRKHIDEYLLLITWILKYHKGTWIIQGGHLIIESTPGYAERLVEAHFIGLEDHAKL